MPYQFSSMPLIQSNQQLAQLLANQIGTLQGGAAAPRYGDTAGAFNAARRAAESRQNLLTQQSQQSLAERAAASGKTFSSAQTAAQSRAAQEGGINLAAILGQLGIQQQDVLGRQAEQTAGAEEARRGQINQLLGLAGNISSGQGGPSYQQYMKDELAREQRMRQYQKEDRYAAGVPTAQQRAERASQMGPNQQIEFAHRMSLAQNPLMSRILQLAGQEAPGISPNQIRSGAFGTAGVPEVDWQRHRVALNQWTQNQGLLGLLMGQAGPSVANIQAPANVMNAMANQAQAGAPVAAGLNQQAFLNSLAEKYGPQFAFGGGR
jgi:hypothetical protein